MAGPNRFAPPCGCCECPQYLCVQVTSVCTLLNGQPYYTGVPSATITVKDSGGTTIATGTTSTGGGWCTNLILVPGDYTVEATKLGYDPSPVSAVVTFGDCKLSKSVRLEMCPETVDVTVAVVLYDLSSVIPLSGTPIGGDTVDITGDCTASETTDTNGEAFFTLTKPAGQCYADLTVSVTPAACRNADPKSTTWRVCFPAPPASVDPFGNFRRLTIQLDPDSTHVNDVLDGGYMPKTLAYSDDLGSCTLTYDATLGYRGTYTFTATNKTAKIVDCGGLLDP
jgi:hypothetical protein